MENPTGGNGSLETMGAADTFTDGRTDGKFSAEDRGGGAVPTGDGTEVTDTQALVLAAAPGPTLLVSATQARPGDRHPAFVYLARLAPGSRRTMGEALTAMTDRLSAGRCDLWTLAWHELRYQHTAALRSLLAEQYAPATVNKMLAALRGTLKECWRLGLVPAEDYHRAVDLPAVRGSVLPRGRALSAGELRALLAACAGDRTSAGTKDRTSAGARDGALIATLYGAGLRRSEAVALEVRDYDKETGAITVRSGKGRKDRIAYAPAGCRAALTTWISVLETRRAALTGGDADSNGGTDRNGEGPLFVAIGKSGRLGSKALSDQAVLYILRKKGQEAGLAAFSPHDLRRTFIGDLLDAGADISTVQQMAGHASVQTTARYDRRGEGAKRKAAELLHVPFREG
jgi:site-specific recombinase XerD